MHPSALYNCQRFFQTYGKYLPPTDQVTVLDVGAQNVNGSLKEVTPAQFTYVGVDFVEGNGVDVVLEDPYSLPFESESLDVVLSSSVFEHSEMFWLLFLEIVRILKPTGLFYLNVPSNGAFHRYPVDCWRFYPDSGNALVKWAQRNGYNPLMFESYVSRQEGDIWNDFVSVFVKDAAHAGRYPERVVATFDDYNNGFVAGHQEILNFNASPEDLRRVEAIRQVAAGEITV